MKSFRGHIQALTLAGVAAASVSLSALADDGASDGVVTDGQTSSDQSKDILNPDFGKGAIEMYRNQQSVSGGYFSDSNGNEGFSGELDINMGRKGLIGTEDDFYYHPGTYKLSLIDFRSEAAMNFELDPQGALLRADAGAAGISFFNYQGMKSPKDGAKHPYATVSASLITIGFAYRKNEALEYEQRGVALRLIDFSNHVSFTLTGSELVDFCMALRPLEWVPGDANTGNRNRVVDRERVYYCEDRKTKKRYESRSDSCLESGDDAYKPSEIITREGLSPTGVAEFCLGVKSANGNWSVRDEFGVETDYVKMGKNFGQLALSNTLTVTRGPVSLWYETDMERLGDKKVTTQKVGVTVKRTKK